MPGKKSETIPPPPSKAVCPPNSAQGATGILLKDAAVLYYATSVAHSHPSALLPVAQGANGLGGHPPPPPPHSPPPPNPKTKQLQDQALNPYKGTSKGGHPPPPPPHSRPPLPQPKSQKGYDPAVVPSFIVVTSLMIASIYSYICGGRIYPTKGVPPDGNTPKPPRPHPDPISPPPPPPRVELNTVLDMFAGIDLLCTKNVKSRSDLLSLQGKLCGGMIIGSV